MIEKIKETVKELVRSSAFELRTDVGELLHKAYDSEKIEAAKDALSWILENAKKAQAENLALCQDTGLPIIFIEAGKGVDLNVEIIDVIKETVSQAYAEYYLRPSAVNALSRDGSAYDGVIVHTEFNADIEGLKITLLAKGFGSENKTQLKMFNPTASFEDIEEFVLKVVKDAGPEACPPFIVGVGIGGTSDSALLMAKEAYLSDLRELSDCEQGLMDKINNIGIGPMGLGGDNTALAVKIKQAKTHIAGLPVGVNISCWATRSASAVIKI